MQNCIINMKTLNMKYIELWKLISLPQGNLLNKNIILDIIYYVLTLIMLT